MYPKSEINFMINKFIRFERNKIRNEIAHSKCDIEVYLKIRMKWRIPNIWNNIGFTKKQHGQDEIFDA